MEVYFFDALTVVPQWIGQSEQTFLEKVTDNVNTHGLCLEFYGCTHSSSFQKENAMFCNPCVSDTPAIPSSPHLKVLERACSCGKSFDN